MDNNSYCCGFIGSSYFPAMLAKVLNDNCVSASANLYCVRLDDFEYFKLEHLSDKLEYEINFDADSSDELIQSFLKIQPALKKITDWFQFEVYQDDELIFESNWVNKSNHT